jgi:hypothetical protein
MEARFETAFLNDLKKHASIKKLVKNKAERPLTRPSSLCCLGRMIRLMGAIDFFQSHFVHYLSAKR